jgi:hypothetical protein
VINIISFQHKRILIGTFFLLAGCSPGRASPSDLKETPKGITTPTSIISNTKANVPTPDSVEPSTDLLPIQLRIAYLNEGYLIFECRRLHSEIRTQ